MTVEEIAKTTHEMNRRYCQLLGDDSQLPWEEAPEWQRNSVIAGVQAILDGTANSPEEQHEQWLKRKLADGWTLGDVKDPKEKTHPCMLPYDYLPASQRAKDVIFRAVVEGQVHPPPRPHRTTMKPSIGRIVHYTNLGDKDDRYPPEIQAAIITKVHDDRNISLKIFYPTGMFDRDSVWFTEHEAGTDEARGKWTWPKRT